MFVELLLTVALLWATVAWFGRKLLRKWLPWVFLVVAILIFSLDALEILAQHSAWSEGPLTRFLLPDYQSGYFAFYSFYRILAPDVFAFIAALVVWAALKWMNAAKDYVLFEKEEPGIAAASILLVGYPGWIIYIPVLLVTYLLWHLYVWMRGKRDVRLPLYSLWPISGIATILLIQYYLVGSGLWLALKI